MTKQTSLPGSLGIIAALALLTGCNASAPLQGPALSWLVPAQYEPQLKAFFAAKEQQARKLAESHAALNGSGANGADGAMAPEVWPYFQAGVAGEWKQAAELYRQMAYRSHHFGFAPDSDPQLVATWQPVNETAWALRMLSAKDPDSFVRYGQDILKAVPAGGTLLATSDAGRFMTTFLCKSHAAGDPINVLSSYQFGDGSYRDYYAQSMFAGKLKWVDPDDVQVAFEAYLQKARERHASGRLKPDEHVIVQDGRTAVSGRGAALGMCEQLVWQFWQRNQDVYVEGPFTPEWARPHFVPRGPVLYLAPERQDGISEADAARDRVWWAARVKEELGEPVDELTPRERVFALARTNYVSLADFGITPEVHGMLPETRRDFAMQAPSSRMVLATQRAQAGKVYWWHCGTSTNPVTKQRMWVEAETAYRQAFALCPNAMDTLSEYAEWLLDTHRPAEAARVLDFYEQVLEPSTQDGDWLKRLRARIGPVSGTPLSVDARFVPLLKAFFVKQEAAARGLGELAEMHLEHYDPAKWQEQLAPEVWPYFAAGKRGDWAEVERLYLAMAVRSEQWDFGRGDKPDPRVVVIWQPVTASYWAFRQLSVSGAQGYVDYAEAVRKSLPADALYFAGSDTGYYLVECVGAVETNPPPFLLISPNQLSGGSYLDRLVLEQGEALGLSHDTVQAAFRTYLTEARQRAETGRPKPGEEVKVVDDRVQVSGSTPVWEINGKVMKELWQGNPGRTVLLEGPFVPDWAWEHATPLGPLLRIEHEPVKSLPPETVAADFAWWDAYLTRCYGQTVTAATPWPEIERMARTNFMGRKDLVPLDSLWRLAKPSVVLFQRCSGPAVQRGQIARLYSTKAQQETDPAAKRRLAEAATLAYRQAFAMCPTAKKVVDDYLYWLACVRNLEEAEAVLSFMESHLRQEGVPVESFHAWRKWFQELPHSSGQTDAEPDQPPTSPGDGAGRR